MDNSRIENSESVEQRAGFSADSEESVTQSVLALFPEAFQQEFARKAEQRAVLEGGLRAIPYDRGVASVIAPELLPPNCDCQDVFSRLEASDKGFGFVDETGLWLDIKAEQLASAGVLVYVPEQAFVNLLDEIFPRHGLSNAERRVLAQVICGQPLKHTATIDGVSHETKRSQFKAVCLKTGLKRQVDLCTFVLSRLLLNIGEQEEDKQPSHEVIRDYHRRFMPTGVRLHVLVDSSGYQHRYFDMGPIGGRALFVLHGPVLIHFREVDIEVLHALQIRLIWPMRPGALAPTDEFLSTSEHVDNSVQAILYASELFAGEQTIDLVGVASGCFYATEFSALYPDKVNRLIYLGAGRQSQVSRSWLDRFFQGLTNLIRFNPATARVMFYFLVKKFGDHSVLADTVKNIFAGSKPDLDVLEGEFSNPLAFDAMQMRYVSSAKSIYHDFVLYTYPNWHKVNQLHRPVFIHGEFDTVHRSKDVEAMAKAVNAQFVVNPGAGHLQYYEHFSSWVNLMSRLCERKHD